MIDDGYMSSNYKWTEWRERFAFFPKRLVLRLYKNDGDEKLKVQWIWLKPYWERYCIDIYYHNNRISLEMDYALNILDILKKS